MKTLKAITQFQWRVLTNKTGHLFAAGHAFLWALYLCLLRPTPDECTYSLPKLHIAIAGRFVSSLNPFLNVVDLPGLLLSMPALDLI